MTTLPRRVHRILQAGTVIPAVPLALDRNRIFAPRYQRALTRYYIDAGAGGVAVGVHSTQFAIRAEEVDLLEPVLECTSRAVDEWADRQIVKIAGVCGRTEQAVTEAELAWRCGYHACLLSLSAFGDDTVDAMIEHAATVSKVMPVIGFYLQPSVGGRTLPYSFWRRFADIENVVAIKVAPFNRYQTLDVVRAVCEAGRENDIALYTGNDDNIVPDLLTSHRIPTADGTKSIRFKGGLLGHWCVWTRRAVELLETIHRVCRNGDSIPADLLTRGIEITDCNAAFFDAANNFAGCIPGIHEVLHRQGLLPGTWCLDPDETLSPGQKEEIDRVYHAYPHLNDDDFVTANLDRWLANAR